MHFTHKKASQSAIRSRKIHPYLKKNIYNRSNQSNSVAQRSENGTKKALLPINIYFCNGSFFCVRPFPRLVFLHSAIVSFVWWDGKEKLISKTHKREGVKVKKTLDRNTSPKCRRPFGWQKAGNEKAQNTALHTEAFLRAHFDGLASAFAFREGGGRQ